MNKCICIIIKSLPKYAWLCIWKGSSANKNNINKVAWKCVIKMAKFPRTMFQHFIIICINIDLKLIIYSSQHNSIKTFKFRYTWRLFRIRDIFNSKLLKTKWPLICQVHLHIWALIYFLVIRRVNTSISQMSPAHFYTDKARVPASMNFIKGGFY